MSIRHNHQTFTSAANYRTPKKKKTLGDVLYPLYDVIKLGAWIGCTWYIWNNFVG